MLSFKQLQSYFLLFKFTLNHVNLVFKVDLLQQLLLLYLFYPNFKRFNLRGYLLIQLFQCFLYLFGYLSIYILIRYLNFYGLYYLLFLLVFLNSLYHSLIKLSQLVCIRSILYGLLNFQSNHIFFISVNNLSNTVTVVCHFCFKCLFFHVQY